jgi:polar amino acid transport system substrate-binding protein
MLSAFRPVLAAVAGLLLAAACAPADESGGAGQPPPSASPACDKGSLDLVEAGKLTIGTDKPAYEPWFAGDDPSNGRGFESAVAYAVAGKLGFDRSAVTWTVVPFNNAIAPGPKRFDFDINQVSISDERRAAVDFSSGYYDVRQALIALKSSKIAGATTVDQLRGAKLGAQVGSTSLDTITGTVRPAAAPAVYQKNDLAKSALRNGQVDGIVLDLPTAFYVTAAEVTEAKIVGQFQNTGGKPEQFGLVLDKGSPLTPCVTRAVDALRADGTLAKLEQQWLADTAGAPVLE